MARGFEAKGRGFFCCLLFVLLGGAFIAKGVALAAAPGTGTTVPGFHHNTHQPINITADKLDVQQNQKIAIFSGKVIAVQGEMTLRSDVLKVHYRGNAAAATATKNDPVPKPAASGGDNAMGAISEIDAYGHVFLVAPGETAQGAVGVYNVGNHTMVLTGNPVILTRDKNVLTGARVWMNLDTGKSVLTPAAGGRVHGLFVPQRQGGTRSAQPSEKGQ